MERGVGVEGLAMPGTNPVISNELREEWPSISVVIPCFNSEQWIKRAVSSALGEQYPRLEIIVIDDGSTDGSLDIAKSFGNKIYIASGANRGACAARNKGMSISRSEYIMFLDSDDYVEGPLFEGIARCIRRRRPNVVISHCVLEKEGERRRRPITWREDNVDEVIEAALQDLVPQGGAYCYDANFIRSIGGWNEKALRDQDVELRLRMLMYRPSYAINDSGSAVWCVRESHLGISTDMRREVYESVLGWEKNLLELFLLDHTHRLSHHFGKRLYNLGILYFQKGWFDIAEEALATSRRLGFNGHLGSPSFRVAAALLGARKAVLLQMMWARLRGATMVGSIFSVCLVLGVLK